MAFCTLLRRRTSFASIVPTLAANGFLQAGSMTCRQLRFILLSPHALRSDTTPDTMARIRRFIALTGGPDLAIVMLLSSTGSKIVAECSSSSKDPYEDLLRQLFSQADLAWVPVLPLATLEKLPALLRRYTEGVLNAKPVHTKQDTPSTFDILRQCTMSPPIEESMAYYITDIFFDIRDLARACRDISVDDLCKADLNEQSPYFSSSQDHHAQSTQVGSASMSKLRKLKAFNAAAAMNIITFWQNK
ncbi:hypothetical protein AMS68_000930 [Peltaster fructicola]|uniref:Uncharacterized protein n=1 Tax=Peltaster fructicola TaxID=286661 RepID=A0A6H0XL18_9PEZI|nr:hypothetical protein AMS68_000930 [Peltaster fructicola]